MSVPGHVRECVAGCEVLPLALRRAAWHLAGHNLV